MDGETQTDELEGDELAAEPPQPVLPDPVVEMLRGEYDHHGEPELRDAEHNGTTMDNVAGEPAMLTGSQMQELMSSSMQAAVDEVAAMPTFPDMGSEEGGATASTMPWRPPSQLPDLVNGGTTATNLDVSQTSSEGGAKRRRQSLCRILKLRFKLIKNTTVELLEHLPTRAVTARDTASQAAIQKALNPEQQLRGIPCGLKAPVVGGGSSWARGLGRANPHKGHVSSIWALWAYC